MDCSVDRDSGGPRAHLKRRRAAVQFVDAVMVERLMPSFSTGRAWLKATVLMVAFTMLIVAIARPRFGIDIEEVSGRGVDLFVVLDVSRSMLAEDVKPNRLERAKSDVLDLMTKLEGDRVGLIVFAGAPVVQVPLTTDQGFYRMMLDDIDTNSAPRGGTSIGDAIRKALESMEARANRDQAIVLITDGGDQDSFPMEAAKQAAERNVRIIAIGLGDVSEGARIPKRADDGGLTFVQHEGQEVWSKMDQQLLKDIATTTMGAYVPAQTLSYDLGQIYDDELSRMTQGEINAEKTKTLSRTVSMVWRPRTGFVAGGNDDSGIREAGRRSGDCGMSTVTPNTVATRTAVRPSRRHRVSPEHRPSKVCDGQTRRKTRSKPSNSQPTITGSQSEHGCFGGKSIHRWLAAVTWLLLPFLLAADTPQEVIRQVRQGVQHFRGQSICRCRNRIC